MWLWSSPFDRSRNLMFKILAVTDLIRGPVGIALGTVWCWSLWLSTLPVLSCLGSHETWSQLVTDTNTAQLTSGSTTPQAATRLCSAEPKEVDSAHTYVTGGKHSTALLWKEILEGVILLRSYAIHTPVPICHWSQANQPLTLRKLHPATEGNHTYTGTPNV